MPQVCTMGRKIGVKIRTAGVGSIKQPTTRSTIFMINKMMYLLLVNESKDAAIVPGRRVLVITYPIIPDTHTKYSITAVVFTLFQMILGKSLIVILR